MTQSIQSACYFLLSIAISIGGQPLSPECQGADVFSTPFHLVGVGPGDADLMTLRAARVIENADIIICRKNHSETFRDYLQGKEVHHEFSGMIPFYSRDPSLYEGEERKRAEQYQAKRLKLIHLVRGAAKAGRTVAVLDNGDPMIFGPSTWMLEEFADLKPQVVPGLSSFNAANAALGTGITSGGRTKSVTLTAGDWIKTEDTIEKLSVHRNTMVLFTMRAEFQDFIEKLSINYPAETPIAIVQQAGHAAGEKIIRSTLGSALEEVASDDLPFEYLIYVGDFLARQPKQ
ncbi:Cobalt-precorrin-4 C(11)-methyltransferase [Roseimaritima multifibrata]|uniref:Cobalt-precorrin-4 C(11)-methyltransferase n=1 Tax=Roseimaritima multifibrata TaxID=1930274 RepID=A0A517MNR3_9BACT|nr:SAM-dependent methyltransferase [Roseimaritima multifibrata]QDS96525.1 Cobalt-precorrin-4 C(11)-methyltransferase [Roseimaritima multifibrata]